MPSQRPRRRLLCVLLALPVLFLVFLFFGSRTTSPNLFSTSAHSSKLPDEIFGLLHFVTSPDEAHRVITAAGDPSRDLQLGIGAVVPEQPIDLTWYAFGSISKAGRGRVAGAGARRRIATAGSGWDERLRVLREEYPLVVFSKSYCPYSNRAKKLLELYDLVPAPKIIEVDLREDASHIKTVLTRLTQQSTFPNVILHGRSLGGSDDLLRFHEEDRLRHMLETAGVSVRWTGEGGERVL